MTPDEILQQSRQAYNAVGDTFFSSTELYNLIWQAEQQLAMQTFCIKKIQTTSTVISQQEYVLPTTCISLKRITYNGSSLRPINFTEDDAITNYDAATTATGEPLCYTEWGTSVFLRPIPDAVYTLKLWFFAKPAAVTTATVLEVPEEYHLDMVNFILSHMFGKDGKTDMAAYHLGLWQQSVERIKGWERRKLRSNWPAAVNNIDALAEVMQII